MRKIDEQRADLERDEFINLCIDMALDQDGAVEDEADEDLVVCLIPGGAGVGAAVTPGLPAAAQRPGPRRAPASAAAATEAEQAGTGQEPLPLAWWIPAALLFGFGDTLTSALVLSSGGVELNPVMRFALEMPGGLWTFALAKTIFLAALMLIGSKAGPTLKWVIPLLTTAVGSYLVWNNIFAFVRLS